jgi:hypothetical protein
MTMRLLKIDRRPNLAVWTYLHPTRGIIRTIVGTHEPNVTHVGGPRFGAGEAERPKPRVRSRNSQQRPRGRERRRHKIHTTR